jgi:hypothetical protein
MKKTLRNSFRQNHQKIICDAWRRHSAVLARPLDILGQHKISPMATCSDVFVSRRPRPTQHLLSRLRSRTNTARNATAFGRGRLIQSCFYIAADKGMPTSNGLWGGCAETYCSRSAQTRGCSGFNEARFGNLPANHRSPNDLRPSQRRSQNRPTCNVRRNKRLLRIARPSLKSLRSECPSRFAMTPSLYHPRCRNASPNRKKVELMLGFRLDAAVVLQ